MKTTILYLFSISLLLQSCYSYKTINFSKENLVIAKKYKINRNKKIEIVSLIAINDSSITVKKYQKIIEIPNSEIISIKKRKFAIGKTISCTISLVLVSGAVLILSSPIKLSPMGPMKLF